MSQDCTNFDQRLFAWESLDALENSKSTVHVVNARRRHTGQKLGDTCGIDKTSESTNELSIESADAETFDESDEEDWIVVHDKVLRRLRPSLEAKFCGVEKYGCIVRGTVMRIDGIAWLRVCRLYGRSMEGSPESWMLIDGKRLGFGELLRKANITLRLVPGRGRSLIATKDFVPGETVVEDSPFFVRPSPKQLEGRTEWTQDIMKNLWTISAPLPSLGDDKKTVSSSAKVFASPAMVRDAIGFGSATSLVRKQVLEMYSPNLSCDHPLVAVAGKLAELCIEHFKECRHLDSRQLQRAILAIEMNIFEGGRCFRTFSCVNHSCFPNMIYTYKDGRGRFKALGYIRAGDELVHSYLGQELLLPTGLRRWHLWRSKCFDCMCERCVALEDPTRDVPCENCDQRATEGMDESGVVGSAYFDEAWAVEGGLADLLLLPDQRDAGPVEEWVPKHLWLPIRCLRELQSRIPHTRFGIGGWRCPTCMCRRPDDNDEERVSAERLLGRLAEKRFLDPTLATSLGSGRFGLLKPDAVEQTLNLAITVWRVLGLRHWASQWARIFCIDLVLSKLESENRLGERTAEALVSYSLGALNALWDWLESLGLAHEPGCFLYTRAAAALRERKSRKLLKLSAEGEAHQNILEQRVASKPQVTMMPRRRLVIEGTVSFQ